MTKPHQPDSDPRPPQVVRSWKKVKWIWTKCCGNHSRANAWVWLSSNGFCSAVWAQDIPDVAWNWLRNEQTRTNPIDHPAMFRFAVDDLIHVHILRAANYERFSTGEARDSSYQLAHDPTLEPGTEMCPQCQKSRKKQIATEVQVSLTYERVCPDCHAHYPLKTESSEDCLNEKASP